MRVWLLTNTTYGTWLPGDPRGSVTSVRDRRPGEPPNSSRTEHDRPGEALEKSLPGLYGSARTLLTGPAIHLTVEQGETLLAQFQETATHRSWTLHAVAIMANHFHLVLEASGAPDPRKLLADLKAYGNRALNRQFGRPTANTWWTSNGSKRMLTTEQSIEQAVDYVLYKQPYPLLLWSRYLGRLT